jgi:hypothetical protein
MKYGIRIAIMILFSVKEWSRGPSFHYPHIYENYPHILRIRTLFSMQIPVK